MITKGRNNQMIGYIERQPEFFKASFTNQNANEHLFDFINLESRLLRVKATNVITYSNALRSQYLHNLCENELHLWDSFLQGKDYIFSKTSYKLVILSLKGKNHFFFFKASNRFVRSSKSISSSLFSSGEPPLLPRGVSTGTAGRSGRSRNPGVLPAG